VEPQTVALNNGEVLVFGGSAPVDSPLSPEQIDMTADLYDPSTGTWKPTGDMVIRQRGAVAIQLADGGILVAGGHLDEADQTTAVNAVEIYNPVTGIWHAAASMHVARGSIGRVGNDGPTAVRLRDGRVLVAGGTPTLLLRQDADVGLLSSAEIYDPKTDCCWYSPHWSCSCSRFPPG
jgi:N-acetylneuraminic acid mutarotase